MKLSLRPRNTRLHPVRRVLLLLPAAVLVTLSFACVWAARNFDNIDLAEIVFYLTMPLRGTAISFIRSITLFVFLPSGLTVTALALMTFLPRGKRLVLTGRKGREIALLPLTFSRPVRIAGFVLWLAVLLPAGDRILDIRGYVDSYLHASSFIEEHYVDPRSVPITFPEKKRNLITVYIESAETTNQDAAHGGQLKKNYTPELTALAEEFVSFSQSGLLEGAAVAPACGWTIAGLVAETAGLPLKLFGYGNRYDFAPDNMGMDLIRFLPGAWTLGDILEEAGYRNVFWAGSDFDFGGRRQYYLQHGSYEIHDYYSSEREGLIPEGYYSGWGFEDEKLYAFVKDELLRLHAAGQPFHLAMLTVDTHMPGYPCRLCPEDEPSTYGKALRCSSRQAADFIAWCREQPFWEDTVIVLTGDHASMTLDFYRENGLTYDRYNGSTDRLVYNCFINAAKTPAREKNRRFTTLDLFPTTLSALGVTIEGGRLGLGTDLFSDTETLAERYGYEDFFTEVNRKSLFYDRELLRGEP